MLPRPYAFVPHVAARHLRASRSSGRIASSALAILGVAAGVMTLVAVTGVMNGFQLGFIEDIVEVSSYHLQVSAPSPLGEDALAALRAVAGITSAVAFGESQAVVESDLADPRGCAVRALEPDALDLDRGFAEHLVRVEGDLDLRAPFGVLIGDELSRSLGVGAGEPISVLSLSVGEGGALSPRRQSLVVTGVFRTGYYDYDLGMVFVSLETAAALFHGGREPTPTYGLKISSRFADREAAARVETALRAAGAPAGTRVRTWRDFNRGFYSALALEKALMVTLPGLIFVVVAFGIYHAQKRAVWERREEIALLAALGARPGAIRAVFVLEGGLVGLAGSLPGLVAGLAISANVDAVFDLVERIVNAALSVLELAASPFAAGSGAGFSIFSPAFFYMTEIPARVLLPEAIGITAAGVLSSVVAALLASSRILDISPAEVLRYE